MAGSGVSNSIGIGESSFSSKRQVRRIAKRMEGDPALNRVDLSGVAAPLGIVTVNWNGWQDTLECLEAIFRMQGFLGPVVVVDNGSQDGSIDLLIAWAMGQLCVVPQSRQPQIERLVIPPVTKPITARILDPLSLLTHRDNLESTCRLFIIRAGQNLGFAAANNLGIKLLLKSSNIELIWFINNDALPREDAFREITSAAGLADEPLICGSALLEYMEPMTIQALGGLYSLYSGVSTHIMAGMHADSLMKLEQRVAVDYPVGAAMLVNRSFITKYGLMCEEYFLYFEEIDWALRMSRPRKAYAVPRSIVYHKGGAATAAGRKGSTRNLPADYYMLRNRLLLARRVSLGAFICGAILAPGMVIRRMFRKRKGLVFNAVNAVKDGLLGHSGMRPK
jgi:GT2 family glycosyltransferase